MPEFMFGVFSSPSLSRVFVNHGIVRLRLRSRVRNAVWIRIGVTIFTGK